MKCLKLIALLLICMLMTACAKRVRETPPPPPPPVAPAELADYTKVATFFATDRTYTPGAAPNVRFGSGRGELRYGIAQVSIPRDHRMGEIERPFVSWVFREDPSRHVVLLKADVVEPEVFYRQVGARMREGDRRSALIFVHGYNVEFQEAAYRTAQMAYDLGFEGAPIFYSWPSAGTFTGYARDAGNIEWSQANIEQFLVDFFRRSEAEDVYLVAHSMGNRALTRAISAAAEREPGIRTKLRQVVLAAPDVDAAVFRTQIAPRLVNLGAPVTLYASSADNALEAARQLFGGFPRAGQSGEGLVVLAGIDTIDASAVESGFLGHSYYGNNRSILSDMFHLLRGRRPEERAALARAVHRDGHYWMIRP